jgi:hypothetical protein
MNIPVRIIEGSFLDFGDGNDEFTQWAQKMLANGETPVVQLTRDVQLELRGGKIPVPGAQPRGVTEEGIDDYHYMDLGWDPEQQRRVNQDEARPNGQFGSPDWRGQYGTAKAGKRGVVLAVEPFTQMVEIMVPLHSTGKLNHHLMRGWVSYDDVAIAGGYAGLADPFKRRGET